MNWQSLVIDTNPGSPKLARLTALMWQEIAGCQSWVIDSATQGAWPLQIAQLLDNVGVPVTVSAKSL